MSQKLVKRQLQLSNDDIYFGVTPSNLGGSEASHKRQLEEDKKKKRQHNKRQKQQQAMDATSEDVIPLNHDDIIAWHLSSMTSLDEEIQSKSLNGEKVMSRLEKEQSQQGKRKKKTSKLMLGNSRNTSSQLRQLIPIEPTFNKTKYREQQKDNRLREIAKLLKKQDKEKNKKQKKTQK